MLPWLTSPVKKTVIGDRATFFQVKPEALSVQTVPYIIIIALAALLSVPPAWRGLQPIDGWIMLGAYVVYLIQAIARKRVAGQEVRWHKSEIAIAVLGVVVLANALQYP